MAQRNYSSTAAPTTLSAGIGGNAGTDTFASVASVVNYPLPPFTAAIDRGQTNEECVLVTAGAGNTWTIQRGYDGTPVSTHATNAQFEHCVAAIDYREANLHKEATGAHGVATVVGTTETQTLSGKTLVVPLIADFTGAQHDHVTVAKGGPLDSSLPRGYIVQQIPTSDTGSITTTETSINGLNAVSASMLFTGSRRVRIDIDLGAYSSVANDEVRYRVYDDTAGTTLIDKYMTLASTSNRSTPFFSSTTVGGLSGVHVFRVTAVRTVGSGNIVVQAARSRGLIIEDLGD